MSDFEKTAKILADFRKKMNYDNISCHEICHDSLCHESINSLICHDSALTKTEVLKKQEKLSKDDWWYLVEVLEKWRVYNPRAIITKYGAMNCWEAMIRTKENRPRVHGAYFTKVVRSLAT